MTDVTKENEFVLYSAKRPTQYIIAENDLFTSNKGKAMKFQKCDLVDLRCVYLLFIETIILIMARTIRNWQGAPPAPIIRLFLGERISKTKGRCGGFLSKK